MSRPAPRRASTFVLVAVLLGSLLTGCVSKAGEAPGGTSSGSGARVTVQHIFGTTKVEPDPQRVVAIGGGDMETAIALGKVPVAAADWFSKPTMRSWVSKALNGEPAPKLIIGNPPDYEKVASFRPDLILYVNAPNDEDVYQRLTKIAPTVAAPTGTKNVYGVTWKAQVNQIGKALGRTAQAANAISDTEKTIAATVQEHPDFQGKTITAGVFSADKMSVWLPSDPRMQLLQQLGFTVNPRIAAMDDGNFYVGLSGEQLEIMNADLILLAATDKNGKVDPHLQADKVFANLSTVKQHHLVYFGGAPVINTDTPAGEFSSAFSIGGPLGIKYALTKLAPMLQKGLDGK